MNRDVLHYPRIFVLGAGFSKPAGLPLAGELFPLVREDVRSSEGGTGFDRDVRMFLDYRRACGDLVADESSIDMEELLAFLDVEHYMGLRGTDTLSPAGNGCQLLIRQSICKQIHSRTPKATQLPRVYYRFAEQLRPGDVVITFNYDLVLERALEYVKRPYRRYRDRLREDFTQDNANADEVIVLKLHGSVDWVDSSARGEPSLDLRRRSWLEACRAAPLVDCPLPKGHVLRDLMVIGDLDSFYLVNSMWLSPPLILAPSPMKFVYGRPILDLWFGLGELGDFANGLAVIGFSLPSHDEYLRVLLYKIASNYLSQSAWSGRQDWAPSWRPTKVRMIDRQTDRENKDAYKRRYSFIDPELSKFCWDGFGEESIRFLFGR